MTSGEAAWRWIFGTLAALNSIGAAVLIFGSKGTQDAAGRGMQAGFGVIGFLAVVALVALGWFVRTPLVRVPY